MHCLARFPTIETDLQMIVISRLQVNEAQV